MASSETQIDTELQELEYFIHLSNESCIEALQELKEPLGFLSMIDDLYMDFFPAAGGISPPAAGMLLLNAHSSFRAGVRLALSGQLLPVFMTLRGSIESALYAHAMTTNPQLQQIWLDRDKNKRSRDVCRKKFSAANIFRCLEEACNKDNMDFKDYLLETYQNTIDFGAHPNSHLLLRSTRIEELDNGEHAVNFAYIYGADSFELRQSLIACAEIGIAVFFVVLFCFDKHPLASDLNKRVIELQGQLPSFIRSLGLNSRVAPATRSGC